MCAALGLVQTVYLLVYLLIRARRFAYILIPGLCFLSLACGFLADFGTRYIGELPFYDLIRSCFWFLIPPLSVLLIVQILGAGKLPHRKYWALLCFPLLAVAFGGVSGVLYAGDCSQANPLECSHAFREQMLALLGGGSGAASLLMLWVWRRGIGGEEGEKPSAQDRYWLSVSLISLNILLIFLTIWQGSLGISVENFLLSRDILGVAMVYLSSTALLRIYPQSVKAMRVVETNRDVFSPTDTLLVGRLEELINLQKVYQEPAYSRASLARELGTSEAIVSRLVNTHFGKSVPQLLNERRVREAEQLLAETAAPVALIAEQVGFNSLASFNRVFREITGKTPSESRQRKA